MLTRTVQFRLLALVLDPAASVVFSMAAVNKLGGRDWLTCRFAHAQSCIKHFAPETKSKVGTTLDLVSAAKCFIIIIIIIICLLLKIHPEIIMP